MWLKGKYAKDVAAYVDGILDGSVIAGEDLQLAAGLESDGIVGAKTMTVMLTK